MKEWRAISAGTTRTDLLFKPDLEREQQTTYIFQPIGAYVIDDYILYNMYVCIQTYILKQEIIIIYLKRNSQNPQIKTYTRVITWILLPNQLDLQKWQGQKSVEVNCHAYNLNKISVKILIIFLNFFFFICVNFHSVAEMSCKTI